MEKITWKCLHSWESLPKYLNGRTIYYYFLCYLSNYQNGGVVLNWLPVKEFSLILAFIIPRVILKKDKISKRSKIQVNFLLLLEAFRVIFHIL